MVLASLKLLLQSIVCSGWGGRREEALEQEELGQESVAAGLVD